MVIEKRQEIISISLTDAPAVSYKTFIFVTVFAVPQRWRLSSFAIRPQTGQAESIPNSFLWFGIHPKIYGVFPKLIPKRCLVQFAFAVPQR